MYHYRYIQAFGVKNCAFSLIDPGRMLHVTALRPEGSPPDLIYYYYYHKTISPFLFPDLVTLFWALYVASRKSLKLLID